MSGPLLFLYGTLLPDRVPPALASAVQKLREVAPGCVPGHLYDLGAYPGAILNPAAGTLIHGRVFALPDDGRVLATLDAYEGFDPRDPAASLFARVSARVALADGREVGCWMYVYNRDPHGAALVAGGRWRKRTE
jgi:gamma-glutamylcyclotransferase (GGCT)/AIG2-like uncharacterized protein YtfP